MNFFDIYEIDLVKNKEVMMFMLKKILMVFIFFNMIIGMNAAIHSKPRKIKLQSREFTPLIGVDLELIKSAKLKKLSGINSIYVIAQRENFPSPEIWENLKKSGIFYASYLGDKNWILKIKLASDVKSKFEEVLESFNATVLTYLKPEDKTTVELLNGNYYDWAYQSSSGLLKVIIYFFPTASATEISNIVQTYNKSRKTAAALSQRMWSIEISPTMLMELVKSEAVEFVQQGPMPILPLMDSCRENTGADRVQMIDLSTNPPTYNGYSGNGITVSNGWEGIANHPDFWNHDSAGNPTTPRYTCPATGDSHGAMTAGIMMGNGWDSINYGGLPFEWRGMAPETTYDRYGSGNADLSSHSYVDSYGNYDSDSAGYDSKIRGDSDEKYFHPHVGAVANQGINCQHPGPYSSNCNVGYYSVYRNSKNEIVVANISAKDFQWNKSSIGPTWDGRIKPDISAPGDIAKFPRNIDEINVEIDYVVYSGADPVNWDFENYTPQWHGGWGQEWIGNQNIGPISQVSSGSGKSMRFSLLSPPWGGGYTNRPLIGSIKNTDGITPLNIIPGSEDFIEISYRMDPIPLWNGALLNLNWATDYNNGNDHDRIYFTVIADGEWHLVHLHVGELDEWNTRESVNFIMIRFSGPSMLTAAIEGGYAGAGGSSAASPVVAGSIALLLDQMVNQFNVTLKDHSNSPFWKDSPGIGVPLPSTFKALLIHTARDLSYINNDAEPDNPDTGEPTVYHKGPDYVTGYGVVDVAMASYLLEKEALQQSMNGEPTTIIEREINSLVGHIYKIIVAPSSQNQPLKVTLAWDDAPGSPSSAHVVPKLVNDLDLLLKSPGGQYYYPWSIDLPYNPTDPSQYPDVLEPEPITTADIHPARNDQANIRDNIEKVEVEFPETGTWSVFVMPSGLAAFPQKYSIVLGTPALPADNLNGGKVVFVSNRTGSYQLHLKSLNPLMPLVQLTNGYFDARHPAWSPNGQYIAYITQDVIVGNTTAIVDVLKIIDANGNEIVTFEAPSYFDTLHAGYPEWSNDGKKIVVTVYDDWGGRGLSVLEFNSAYNFADYSVYQVIPRNSLDPAHLDATDAVFSPDGNWIYFHADTNLFSGGLFKVLSTGGSVEELWGNAEPIRRAYQISISPDGKKLIFNSELYHNDPIQYLDEELVELDLMTGICTQLTKEPGHQYGWFAKGGHGEYVGQSSTEAGGNNNIFIAENGSRASLDIGDPTNLHNDNSPSWWKANPIGSSMNTTIHLPLDDLLYPNIFKDVYHQNDGQTTQFSSSQVVEGVIDQAAQFSGQNYITIPDDSMLNVGDGDFSISLWIKTQDSSRTILDKRGDGDRGYHIYIHNNRVLFQIHGTTGWINYYNSSGINITDGEWHLITIIVDRDKPFGGKIYVDDQVDLSFDPRPDFGSLDNTAKLYLGRHKIDTNPKFKGIMDDFRLMKKALDYAEVISLFRRL